jgi:threonine/homoserine/homoserine lactone efflux protein
VPVSAAQVSAAAAAITGAAALVHTSAVALQAVKDVGVAYLLYIALATWRDRGALTVDEDAVPRSARKVITSGVLINILNPKLTISFFAVYGVLAAAARQHVISRPRFVTGMRRFFAFTSSPSAPRLAAESR